MEPKNQSAQLTAAIVLLAVVIGVALTVVLLHPVPAMSLVPHANPLDKPLPSLESRQPVVVQWVATSDRLTYLGLRDDFSVIWRQTKRIGELPPSGQPPKGERGASAP